jgi:hypothetical protein
MLFWHINNMNYPWEHNLIIKSYILWNDVDFKIDLGKFALAKKLICFVTNSGGLHPAKLQGLNPPN